MWELICHHEYCWGTIAADRSPWQSDGIATAVTPLPGQPGLRFSTPQSRIVIPRREVDAWSSMRAIRVEIVASSLQAGGTVIDADRCFRISFEGPRRLVVEILGQTFKEDIVDLPLGTWVYFNFEHDGVNQFTYGYFWSATVGAGSESGLGGGSPVNMPGMVPPVGPNGVWIGSHIGSPAKHLNGNIRSVKIWRLDPQIMKRNFAARPFPPPLVDCWANLMRKFEEAAAADPECAAWLKNAIENVHLDVFKRLSQKTPETVAEFWSMLDRYQQLWAAGKVGSPEMQDLMVRLRDWLKDEGVFSIDDPHLQTVFDNPCVRKFGGLIGGLECDAEAQALLRAMLGLGNEQKAHG